MLDRHRPAARLMRWLLAPALSVGAIAATPDEGRACGAFFRTETSQNLAIGAQRALMIVGDDEVSLHLQLAARTDGKAFSWVIPVPGQGGTPTVELGEQAIFDALDALTTPSVTISEDGGSGGGLCAGDVGKAGGDSRGAVQHFGGATLGPYTYDLIAGSSADAIGAWLDEHGYVPADGLADALTPYTDRSVFVAVRLNEVTAADAATLRPLALRWPRAFEAGLGYALGLSRLSAAEVQPLLLWILADKRQRVANFGSLSLEHLARTMRDVDLDYEDALAALTGDAGGRLVLTEFARDLRTLDVPAALAALVTDQHPYLTRLYAAVPRDALEDLVITFAAGAPDVDPHVTVSHAEGRGGDALMIASALGALAVHRRRRATRPDSRARPRSRSTRE